MTRCHHHHCCQHHHCCHHWCHLAGAQTHPRAAGRDRAGPAGRGLPGNHALASAVDTILSPPCGPLLTAPGDSVLHWLPVPGAGWLPRPQHGAARPRHQPVQGVRQAEQGDTGGSRAGNEVSQCPEKDPRAFSLLKAMKALSQIRHYAEHGK